MIGIILAAGDGSRYKKSSGEDNCKILSTVNGRFLLEFALNNLKALGISKAFIVVGESGDAIKKEIGCNYDGITISYVHQPVRKGLINALMQAIRAENSDDIILQLADEIFINLRQDRILSVLTEEGWDFLCGITHESDKKKIMSNYSVCIDELSYLKKCTEKPTEVINDIKGTGLCIFNKHCIQLLRNTYNEEKNEPCDLCDYMNLLISSGKKGRCICVADKEFNINEHSDLQEAAQYYADNLN